MNELSTIQGSITVSNGEVWSTPERGPPLTYEDDFITSYMDTPSIMQETHRLDEPSTIQEILYNCYTRS